jgi:dephospho-CoA kinase
MLKVGITGGIGSGKSVVCQVFNTLGIPVFNADEAARYLMENDAELVQRISQLLGNEVYVRGKLDRAKVSEIIYRDPAQLQQLNALVHPATISYSRLWLGKQSAPYTIKETAIFFESGSYKEMDVMIGVYAPQLLRMQRAMKRSTLTAEKVLGIMAQQMNEDEKMKRCDHVITNDDVTAVLPQVLQLHQLLQANAATG